MLPLVALGLVRYSAGRFYTPLKIQYQETREQARLEAELASLQERNESLSAQVERLKTPEGVEEVARESLGMVKPGENLYVVIDPAEEATTAARCL
jgi:cell division protein FtsL